MKHLLIPFSCLLLLLNISCEKAGQIHLISAHTWVVTEISSVSNFAKVGDEITFHDNRLFFNISNGVETDGRWDFPVSGVGPIPSYDVDNLFVTTSFGSYDFSILKLNSTELEIQQFSNFGNFTVSLKAKE